MKCAVASKNALTQSVSIVIEGHQRELWRAHGILACIADSRRFLEPGGPAQCAIEAAAAMVKEAASRLEEAAIEEDADALDVKLAGGAA